MKLLGILALQVHLWTLRFSSLFLLAFTLTSCASRQLPPATYAPSPAGVLRAVTQAKASAQSLKSEVSTPAGLRTLADLNTSLDTSLTEVAAYSSKVDQLSVSLTKAEESATYYREKQLKALREIWMWRGLAGIALAMIAAWIAWRIYKPSYF